LDCGAFWNASSAVPPRRLADYFEVPRVQPPALRPVVERRAANGVLHRMKIAARCRRRRRGGARCRDLLVRLLDALRPAAIIVPQLVGREIAASEPGPGLE